MAARVLLHARRAKPFYARHPWVYPGAIAEVEGHPKDGDAVEVFSHGGNFIAYGLYNSQSRIRVRLYSWELDRPIDEALFRTRLADAMVLRRDVLGLTGPQRACRLVFSEGDGLSGMIVDQYDRWLVMQFTSLALAERRELIVKVLRELVQPEGIYLRTERGIGKLEGLDLQDQLLWGDVPKEAITIREPLDGNGVGIDFLVSLTEGQKTGFYLDQRENRRLVANLATGRRVLDAFCYVGGFGLLAAKKGASEVIGVDVSAPALELARRNAAQNDLNDVRFEQSDVFDYLEAAARNQEKFDMVVLDPPKFARAQHAVEDALRGYRRLQTLGLMLLNPGGILVTCCCSGLITMENLELLMGQVATEAKRSVQILERRYQPADHPIAVACLESAYLKCLVTRVA